MINLSMLMIYMVTVITYNSTPGPVIMLVTGTRLVHNIKLTILTILGANLGSITLMFIAILAMLGIVKINHHFLSCIIILGCAYLIFTSIATIIRVIKHCLKKIEPQPKKTKSILIKSGFKEGYSIGVSNPKDIIFFAAFFPQFIHVTTSNSKSLILLSLIWAIFDWLILLSYAVVVKKMVSKNYENLFLIISNFCILIIAIMGLREVL